MGRNETVLPEYGFSMGRGDIRRSKYECVDDDYGEKNVCPSSNVSIFVERQDEHETSGSNRSPSVARKPQLTKSGDFIN